MLRLPGPLVGMAVHPVTINKMDMLMPGRRVTRRKAIGTSSWIVLTCNNGQRSAPALDGERVIEADAGVVVCKYHDDEKATSGIAQLSLQSYRTPSESDPREATS
jgi:hypothetical protein